MIKILLKLRGKLFIRRIVFYIFKLIGVEIPIDVKMGKNIELAHWANGLVIHNKAVIEDNVKIYQGVTLGRADIYRNYKDSEMEGILIKNGAILCAGAKVLCARGTLVVGENTIVAANSVLLESTGSNEVWGGIPARKIGVRKFN